MTPMNVCPVCGGASKGPWYSGGTVRREWRGDGARFSVSLCRDCGHGFTDPRPDPEDLAPYYDGGYSAYEAGHGVGDLDAAIDRAGRERRFRHVDLHPDLSVLDVGCGSGSFLRVIRDHVGEVQGVEPSEHGAEICRRLGVPVLHGDLDAFAEVDDRRFDLVTLNHVVDHHPEPVALARLLRRVTKDEGTLWIAVPNAGAFTARVLKGDWHSVDLPVHLQHFTTGSMRRLLEDAGFRVSEMRTVSENSLPGSVAAILRRRLATPRRVSEAFLRGVLSRDGVLGRRLDAAGHGEAVIVSASPAA